MAWDPAPAPRFPVSADLEQHAGKTERKRTLFSNTGYYYQFDFASVREREGMRRAEAE